MLGSLRRISVSLFFIFFSVPALAITTWQGPYVGAYLGGGFGNNSTNTNGGTVTATSYFTTPADVNAVNSAASSTRKPNAMLAGIQIGHDWVWKQLVYGIGLDYSTLSFSSSNNVSNRSYPDNPNQYSVFTSVSSNWLFTLRGRLGYQSMLLHSPTLLYVTGGMAMTQLRVNNNFSDNSALAGAGGASTSQNQIGWTAGAGVEVATFKHVSVDLEYSYVRIPSVTTTSAITNTQGGFGVPAQSQTNPFSTTANLYANLVKIGLNYRFDE